MSERFSNFNDSRTEKLRAQGVMVDGPKDMLQSHEAFAQLIETKNEILAPGISFEQSSLMLSSEGNFTNRYRVVFETSADDKQFLIDVKDSLTHINRTLINDETVVCAINGGFFLLLDETLEAPPREITYGTIVKNGVLCGVQSHDRPVLWVDKEGALHVSEVTARGKIKIGDVEGEWTGGKSAEAPATFVVFGPDCSVVQHVFDGKTGQKRVMNEELSKTPATDDVTDVICEQRGDEMFVSEIRSQGGSLVTKGNFIIQGNSENLRAVVVGDKVEVSYSDLQLDTVTSAITIGPSVTHFENEIDHPINHDLSLGEKPPFTNRPMARSVVYKTITGNVVFEIFDGAPKTDLFKGVTPKEVGEILKNDGLNLEWAYFLDPGQSARLAVRHQDGTVQGFGNQHYIRWPKESNHPYIWAGEHGRAIPSVISVKIKK